MTLSFIPRAAGFARPMLCFFTVFAALTGLGLGQAHATPAGRVVLPGHFAPQAVARLTRRGTLDPKRDLALDLILPLRNQADLDNLMRRLYDPADPLYGKYLTPEQFTDRFGPSVADVSAVAAFAKSQGMTLTSVAGSRRIVRVHGPVSAIQTAFGVTMQHYTGPEGTDFYGPDTDPTIPAALAGKFLAIAGLNKLGRPHAFYHRAHPSVFSPEALPPFARSAQDITYSGNAGLSPNDIHSIYNLTNVASKGTGQTIALYELDTFTPSDITTYEQYYGLPDVPVQGVGVNGFNPATPPGGAAIEVTLDIEMCLAVAPSASKILVYEADGGTDFETANVEIFNQIASDDLASVASVSYGLSELDFTLAGAEAVNQTLMQIAAQGQTICIASGDAGAYTDQSLYPNELPNTSEPGSQPLALSVGGTDLTDSSTYPYTYVSETSWDDPNDSSRGSYGVGGGGGISQFWAIPSYQVGAFSTSVNTQGSTTMRNVPDVSLYSYSNDDTGGYDVYFSDPDFGPGWYGVGGTSAATPLWAAFLTDVNQGRTATSAPKLGLSNTAIYAIAKQSSKYASDFHDINDHSTNLYYTAVTGYDDSTGWGSFNGINLYNDLVGYSTTANVTVQSLVLSPNPVISGSPLTGTVTLSDPAPSGGAAVVIAVNGATHQTVTVPAGASSLTFPFTLSGSAGTYTVTATYRNSVASVLLTVNPAAAAPVVTSFSPTSGTTSTIPTVTGRGFTGAFAVTLDNESVPFAVISDTSLIFAIPSGAQSGKIAVTTPAGTGQSSLSFTVLPLAPVPVITGFSPASGPVGSVVTVTGTALAGATQVTLNGQPVGYSSVTGTSLKFIVPSGASSGAIIVTTLAGTAQSSTPFTVSSSTSAPTITGFSPASGPVGTTVAITGTNLTGATVVGFTNAHATSFTVNGAGTQVTTTVPSGAITGTIAVLTPGGEAKSATSFTVTTASAAPAITGFSPASGTAGTVVTITGTNLTGATVVGFQNAHATTFSVNGTGTQITATVPSGALTGQIAVATPSGEAKSATSFTIIAPPTITGISPSSGPVGTTVTITGTNLTGATVVGFQGQHAKTFTVNGAGTQITATVPAGASTGTIAVATPGGTAKSTASFTVTP